jgi:glycosyltransferase involved in cell wall biosynthesis
MSAKLDVVSAQLESTKLQNFRMRRLLNATKLDNFRMQHSSVWLLLKPFRRLERAIRNYRKQFATRFLFDRQDPWDYDSWVRLYDSPKPGDATDIKQQVLSLKYQPLIAVLMPVHDTPEKFLRRAIESVRGQCYENWELCIADDASTQPHVGEILRYYRKIDPRIKVVFGNENVGISRSLNAALELANAEFTAMLDHDDELAPHALYAVAKELNLHPDTDLIYSDNDCIDEQGRRHSPYFKPDWNPDLLLSLNFIGRMTVYRTERIREAGGFREEMEGSQDWDLSLRVTEKTGANRIRHIPHALYHWRDRAQSAAPYAKVKPRAITTAMRAVSEHLERKQRKANVAEAPHPGLLRVRYQLDEPPLVSIIICTQDCLDLLELCVCSILFGTTYPNYEILIVDNNSVHDETRDYLQQLAKNPNVRIITDRRPFNYSAMNNAAAAVTRGSVLCFMNNDTEAISPDWLYEMTSHAVREEIGAVGAKLLYPDNSIQHAGVVLGMERLSGHVYSGRPADEAGYMCRAQLIQNYTAVTAACMVVRREVFEKVGGFNEYELKVAFNDIDLCLKIHAAGYRNLWTPYAVLYHHESATRGAADTASKSRHATREMEYIRKQWNSLLLADPAYNPNLTLDAGFSGLAFPPRVKRAWQGT